MSQTLQRKGSRSYKGAQIRDKAMVSPLRAMTLADTEEDAHVVLEEAVLKIVALENMKSV